jgi:hypothetical protein
MIADGDGPPCLPVLAESDLADGQDVPPASAVNVLAAPGREQQITVSARSERERLRQLIQPRPSSQAASIACEVIAMPDGPRPGSRSSAGPT